MLAATQTAFYCAGDPPCSPAAPQRLNVRRPKAMADPGIYFDEVGRWIVQGGVSAQTAHTLLHAPQPRAAEQTAQRGATALLQPLAACRKRRCPPPTCAGLQGPHPGRGQLHGVKILAGRQCTLLLRAQLTVAGVARDAALRFASVRSGADGAGHASTLFDATESVMPRPAQVPFTHAPPRQDNCSVCVSRIDELQDAAGGFLEAVTQQAARVDAEKLRAVGLRNKVAALHEVG